MANGDAINFDDIMAGLGGGGSIPGVNSGFTSIYGGSGYAPSYGGSNVPYQDYNQQSGALGFGGGAGAYMGGTALGGQAVPSYLQGRGGRGGVFTVDPNTGSVSRLGQNTTYSGGFNPAYGQTNERGVAQSINPAYAQQSDTYGAQRWLQQNMGGDFSQWNPGAEIYGNNQRAGIYSGHKLVDGKWVQAIGTPSGGNTGTGSPQMPNPFSTSSGTGVGGTGGTGGLSGRQEVALRRLGEAETEAQQRIGEDYQRRGLTQSGLLSDALARNTRDYANSRADLLAMLQDQPSWYQSMMMNSINGLSSSNQRRGDTGGAIDAYRSGLTNQLIGQGLGDATLSGGVISQLMQALGYGQDFNMDFSSWK